MRLRLFGLLFLSGLAVLLSACSSGGGAEPFVNIGMADNFFTRDVTRVQPGDVIRFKNEGATLHNAVAINGGFSTNLAMQVGDVETLTLADPGVYEFYCTLHAVLDEETGEAVGMKATLVVGDVEYTPGVASGETIDPVFEHSGVTRRVPQDHTTIQNAVDAAEPGDLVLIDEGVWFEQVNVTTPYITIRGVDRQDVIIDGEFTRPNAINIAGANGVAVENLTVRNATQNGVFWTSLEGYRASYVTAVNNGVYGIYSFDATDGVYEHSYASSSPDAGYYIGQCDPCRAVIIDSIAEWNGLGYSGTNASGELYIVRSQWNENLAGIVPNTLDTELLPPFHDVTIVGNIVHDNGNVDAPALANEWYAVGAGVALAGGHDALVQRNRFWNNSSAGIAVAPNYSKNFWMSSDNTIRDNVIEASGEADLLHLGPSLGGDCFSGNEVQVTNPPALQAFHGCDGGLRLPLNQSLAGLMTLAGRAAEAELKSFPHGDDPDYWQRTPNPRADVQPDMPEGADALVRHAADAFHRFDPRLENDPEAFLATFDVPAMPDGVELSSTGGINVFGINLLLSPWTVFFGLYAYLLPFVLYAAWVALAIWDLSRREKLPKNTVLGWLAVIFLVPFLGVIAYHAFGKSELPGWLRGAVVGGGLGAYVLILAVGALMGGLV